MRTYKTRDGEGIFGAIRAKHAVIEINMPPKRAIKKYCLAQKSSARENCTSLPGCSVEQRITRKQNIVDFATFLKSYIFG